MSNLLTRPCTPIESLKQSLKEMKIIRNRKAKKRNLDEFLTHLEEEEEKE